MTNRETTEIETKALEELKDVIHIQCQSGNWDYNEYMHGFANGLILAQSIIERKDPEYLDAPKEWLQHKNTEGAPTVAEEKQE